LRGAPSGLGYFSQIQLSSLSFGDRALGG